MLCYAKGLLFEAAKNAMEAVMEVQIGGLTLEHPIMNAAGYCKNAEHAEELARSDSAAVVFGSITVEQRGGNSGNVFVPPLNSLGLPNHGMARYADELPEIITRAKELGKSFILSIAGFSLDDYARLVEFAWKVGADAVEMNFGCGNVWDDGKQKGIISFQTDFIYNALMVTLEPGCRDVLVKLSPYSDPFQLIDVCQTINEISAVTAVVTSNTFANALVLDENGRPTIDTPNGFAGYSGKHFKPIALGQVRQCGNVLNSDIHVIGVGGIENGRDVKEYLSCGASAVQVGTYLMKQDSPKCLTSIVIEYTDLLEE